MPLLPRLLGRWGRAHTGRGGRGRAQRAARGCPPPAQVVARHGRFGLDWASGGPALYRVLWPVVRSAAELLTSEDLRCVRKCAASDCGWIFLDTSRNRRRRWCDMRACGNRAKVRRPHERHRAS